MGETANKQLGKDVRKFNGSDLTTAAAEEVDFQIIKF